jgi:hypothetical protein
MTDPESPDTPEASLVEYIRVNRDRYNHTVLTNTLIRGGHAPDAVAEAWRLADADAATTRADSGLEPNRTRQTALTTIAILLALGTFLLGEFAILAASSGRPMMLLYAVLFPVEIAFVTGWIVRRIGASGGLRRGDAAMTVGWLLVPVLAMVALMGVCVAYGSTFGCVISCPTG